MAKLWEGRSGGSIDPLAERLNASICVDSRMVREDIRGSIAHAAMLSKQGIITPEQGENIRAGLESILRDLDSGKLRVDMSCEDVHTFVEGELTCRIGDDGRRLHTARSRNDQVALDVRLYLRSRGQETVEGLERLVDVLCRRAEETRNFVAPGYTHMQRAQPVTFGHHLMAYAFMLLRDRGRMLDALRRMDKSPIGACALAGTTFPTDREYEAGLLGFSGVTENSMDSVADRDFCVELSAALSLIMTHLSRFSEEIILWSTKEFGFVTVSTAYST
ncbi:MAG: argininosuccinate lyase, partial [Oscillospiraceae bacterium]|nr:argininosuccinate lyase [Oscillospiraceae bacterium]